MRNSTIVFSCLLLATGLFGCANVSTAPVELDAAAKDFEPADGKGVVYLYRPGRAVGAAMQMQVTVNGDSAGGTGPGTYFRFDLLPGSYTLMSSSPESSATVQVQVEAGRMYFVEQQTRLGLQSARVTMRTVDTTTGMAGVRGARLLVSGYHPRE